MPTPARPDRAFFCAGGHKFVLTGRTNLWLNLHISPIAGSPESRMPSLTVHTEQPTQPPHDAPGRAVDADALRDAGIVRPPYFGLDDKSLAVARLHRIVQEAADVSRMAFNAQSRETWTEDDESSLRLAEGEMAVIRRALRRLNGVTA